MTTASDVDAAPLRSAAGAISVVIVNYNAGGYLTAAVVSALTQDAPVGEILVVDNGSTDSSLERLREACADDRLAIVELGRNLGFSRACNTGIAASRGEMVLLLNPDCYLFPGAVKRLAAVLDQNAAAVAAGPLLVNADGSEQRGGRRDIPNPWQIFCYTLGLHRLMPHHPRFRSFNRMGEPLPSGPAVVQAISGACMLVRRSALDELGAFDERYFMHFEDLDWCLRATRANRGVLFVPDAVVEHTQGVCSAARPLRVEFYKHRSLAEFLAKNFSSYYPRPFIAAVRLLVFLHLALRAGRIAVMGRKIMPAPRSPTSAAASKTP